MTPGELEYATKLVRNIISRGHFISVFDGEGYAVKCSRDGDRILSEMAATDMDSLIIHSSANNAVIGRMRLIYGNDPEGSELIADHTDNALCNAIWNEVMGGNARDDQLEWEF